MSKRPFSAKPIVFQLVFESRYDYGHGYLDRAGEAIVELLRRDPGWAFRKADPGFTRLSNAELNATFNFGVAKLDLIQAQSNEVVKLMPVPDFALLANDLTDTVLLYLGPVVPTRIGFRSLLLWEAKSHAAAVDHLRGLESFRLTTPGEDALGVVTDYSFSFVYEALECDDTILFSESNSRFIVEVEPQNAKAFTDALRDVPHAEIGVVTDAGRLVVQGKDGQTVIHESIDDLKESWQKPLKW